MRQNHTILAKYNLQYLFTHFLRVHKGMRKNGNKINHPINKLFARPFFIIVKQKKNGLDKSKCMIYIIIIFTYLYVQYY